MIAVLLALGLGVPALAVDGVIEINQAKVLAGGITAGDAADFPAWITEPGSYRLTSDLTPGSGIVGIHVLADDVTLDLNGFTLKGGGGLFVDGITVASVKNIEIRNGTIRSFSRAGIFGNSTTQSLRVIGVRSFSNGFAGMELQGEGHLVDGCTASFNGANGIRVIDGSLVINSVMRSNTSFGLLVGLNSGYRSNVLTGNNAGDANPQVAGGGLQLGSNVCGTDLVCP